MPQKQMAKNTFPCPIQWTNFINPRMYLLHISHCSIQTRNLHLSALYGALWDMEQVNSEISELGQFISIRKITSNFIRLYDNNLFKDHIYIYIYIMPCAQGRVFDNQPLNFRSRTYGTRFCITVAS